MDKVRRKISWKLLCIATIAVLNLIAFLPGLCRVYRMYIYRPIAGIIGRITSFKWFAIGEICMYIAILLVVVSLLFCIVGLFLKKENPFRIWLKKFYKTELSILLVVLLIYTLVWSIPFRASRISFEHSKDTYTLDEVKQFRGYILEQLELCAKQVPRNANNEILFDFDMDEQCKLTVEKLAEDYPEFAGYQPPMKKALCSDVLEWMSICGFTYPFSMEINYNRYTTRLDYAGVYCHEMSHHFGYYRESEAEFLSILARIKSDNPVIKYSGYRDAYYWIDTALLEGLISSYGQNEGVEIYTRLPQPSKTVFDDEIRNIMEQQSLDSEINKSLEQVVKPYAESVANTGWEVQADLLGEVNYDGVVKLLLDYFMDASFVS